MSQKLFFKNTISNSGNITKLYLFPGKPSWGRLPYIRIYKHTKAMLRWLHILAALELGRETEGIRDEITLSGLVLSQEKAVESM